MLGVDRLAGTVRGHRKPIVCLSAALVVASAGTAMMACAGAASAATVSPAVRQDAAPGRTFAQVQRILDWQTNPAFAARHVIPAADRLLPVALGGPQSFMPITSAQYDNAATIVGQALQMRMGVRSAVIALATAMQESRLQNLDYGTGESLGLFQQQPDCGWGTPQQIMDPSYAADAFLGALQSYQAANPYWASQPLYVAAQGVQGSAFPYAYAQWEIEAAQLTSQIVRTTV
jgi:hypothetical protein